MHSDRRRRRSRRGRFRVFWLISQITFLLILFIILGALVGTFIGVRKLMPKEGIANYQPTEATRIYSSDGVLLANIYEENRESVSIDEIPKDLRDATIAIEDSRFLKHRGVDFIGIGRAVYQNLRRGRAAQGGSTLTQQLARNIYLTREKKLSRKLQEIVLAVQLEREYSKEQILELYLNQVFYGSGSYGVQTASKVYFGKNVKDLTLAECALLAGLPQKPSGYSPYKNLDAAIKRRDTVLNRMAELHYITPEQCAEAKTEKVKLVGQRPQGIMKYKAPWFVTYVIDELTDKYGEDLVYKGGLRVYTTLNYAMQQVAEKELREQVHRARSRNVSQGALICVDPKTGYIKAMVGGVGEDFTKDQFNRAVQARRQPGSSFKAFVYTAAVDNGFDPNDSIPNKPIMYKGKPWPENYYRRGGYRGSYRMRDAIALSVNTCAVRTAEAVGVDQVISYAKMMGIKSPLAPNLSIALGASGVTPLEMCSAYGVFADNGIRAEPMAIVRITGGNGNGDEGMLADNAPITRQVLSEQTAETMSEMFRAVVTRGTGRNASIVPNAHGKTGTTSDDRDAWFVGYTPELSTAVWVGNDDYGKTMRNVAGGGVCAPVWSAFMLKALEIHKTEKEPTQANSDNSNSMYSVGVNTDDTPQKHEKSSKTKSGRIRLTICADSGAIATSHCPSTYNVYFKPGTEPKSRCTIHTGSSDYGENSQPDVNPPAEETYRTETPRNANRSGGYVDVTICVETGQIANKYCPETIVRRYLASEAPRKVCNLHKPPTD